MLNSSWIIYNMLDVVVQVYKSQHWPVETQGPEVQGHLGCPLFPLCRVLQECFGLHWLHSAAPTGIVAVTSLEDDIIPDHL